MFCPKCHCEYEAGIRVCSDCDEKLVEKLPQEEEDVPVGIKFVPLPNLPGRIYAEMVKGALEEREIPCYLRGEGVSDAYQFSGNLPLSGVKLYVPEDKFEECMEIQHQMLNHI